MHLITLRDKIKQVPENWKSQYFDFNDKKGWRNTINLDTEQVYNKLAALNLETCSKEDVNKIIGNDSWTNLECDECSQENLKKVIVVGESQDYDSRTATLCSDCVTKAMLMINPFLKE